MLLRPANASVLTLLVWTLAMPVQTTVGKQPKRAQYSAEESRDIVRLHDNENETTVSIIPSAGNLAVEMRVRGHNVLRFPTNPLKTTRAMKGGQSAFRSSVPGLTGSTNRRSTRMEGDSLST